MQALYVGYGSQMRQFSRFRIFAQLFYEAKTRNRESENAKTRNFQDENTRRRKSENEKNTKLQRGEKEVKKTSSEESVVASRVLSETSVEHDVSI